MSHKPQEFTVQPDTLKIKLRNVVDYSFEPASESEIKDKDDDLASVNLRITNSS